MSATATRAITQEADEAAACGDLEAVRRALDQMPTRGAWLSACGDAAKAGHIEVVDVLMHTLTDTWQLSLAMDKAVDAGRWPIAALLWSHTVARFDPVIEPSVIVTALSRGAADFDRLVRMCGAEVVAAGLAHERCPSACVPEARLDAVESLCALLATSAPDQLDRIGYAAAAAGRVDIVRYMHGAGLYAPDREAADAAAECGATHVIDYLRYAGVIVPNGATERALDVCAAANARWALGI